MVCCSDTHGLHRKVEIPKGDIFIHAGDFTRCANLEDARDFNDWLGDEDIFGDFKLKIVVNGNHESTASWQQDIRNILSNAVFLKNELYEFDSCENNIGDCDSRASTSNKTDCNSTVQGKSNRRSLKIWGCNFFWPMEDTPNPYLEDIPKDVDIIVAHGPAKNYVDAGHGCNSLLNRVKQLVGHRESKKRFRFPSFTMNKSKHLKTNVEDLDTRLLVVSGHIHMAHGVQHMAINNSSGKKVTFVNAANANNEHSKGDGRGWETSLHDKQKTRGEYIVEWQPVVVEL